MLLLLIQLLLLLLLLLYQGRRIVPRRSVESKQKSPRSAERMATSTQAKMSTASSFAEPIIKPSGDGGICSDTDRSAVNDGKASQAADLRPDSLCVLKTVATVEMQTQDQAPPLNSNYKGSGDSGEAGYYRYSGVVADTGAGRLVIIISMFLPPTKL
jgi:hypothetical protein